MIMFTNRRQPNLDTATLKRVMRQKRNFQDGVARFPLKSFWEEYDKNGMLYQVLW